ncbi:MAG TPA: cobalamin-dependent protein, partial [Candidatus Bathyarchaeia archaeon]|nr:cobalamin-dependent protein [Candidatus Bathyarchaeia archaeon]
MKILLINPPRWNELVGKNPSIIEEHRGFNPPLGLLYIAATLRERAPGVRVDVWDAQARRWTYEELEAELRDTDYDLVGISAMTFTLVDSHRTARLVKALHPGTKVVLGGTHVHLFPEETIALDGVDFAFMGEAEFTFSDFVSRIGRPDEYPGIGGLVFRDGQGRLVKSEPALVKDLDRVPFPDRTLLDDDPRACTSGAHTLSKFGDRVYPDMGNGGYTSVHTDVYVVYDATTNLFLPGTHVELTQRATQCLTDFSLDLERTSAYAVDGPNMTVNSV